MEDIKTAIDLLLKDPLISNYQISKATGISQVSLNKFAKGESNIDNMPLGNALKLYNYYLKIKEEKKMRVSEPLIWDLTRKFTALIMNEKNELQPDYEQRLSYIYENTKNELSVEIAEIIKERLSKMISTYQKTGIWDFVGKKNE